MLKQPLIQCISIAVLRASQKGYKLAQELRGWIKNQTPYLLLLLLLLLPVLKTEPKTLSMLDIQSTTELHT